MKTSTRDPALVDELFSKIELAAKGLPLTSGTVKIMEVCGGQTHALMEFGILDRLPMQIELVHGPGCPVCVTPVQKIDQAIELSFQHRLVTYGDMLRVPGTRLDLNTAKAMGALVHVIYSPMDALTLAEKHKDQEVVLFGVGFETTAPLHGFTVLEAHRRNLSNFSLLSSHVLVPPAMELILSSPASQIAAFLAAGHVCTIMGMSEYGPLSERYQVPIAITGFEPVDLLKGILSVVQSLSQKKTGVTNCYERCVSPDGNREAKRILLEVFDSVDREWRGIGAIKKSGLKVREKYCLYDAEEKFKFAPLLHADSILDKGCISGEILLGIKKPIQCTQFAKNCHPDHPLGAPMVSAEGTCQAYFHAKGASFLEVGG